MPVTATGTATDPLGASDSDVLVVADGGATGLRTMLTSFFKNRINWGNITDISTQGPAFNLGDFIQTPAGPVTLGTTLRMLIGARILGMRVYKNPATTGSVAYGMWDSSGAELASKTVTWSADNGGWVTLLFDAPVAVAADEDYHFGYHYPGTDDGYAASTWVWSQAQDTVVYPFHMEQFAQSGAGVKSGGAWASVGASLTPPAGPTNRQPANYYVDPIVEWDTMVPGYSGGTSYYNQFINGGSRFAFPVAIWFSDPPFLSQYKAMGINTLVAGTANDDYLQGVVAADLDWWPALHGNDMGPPIAVQEDASVATCVRGYLVTDEPELITPWNSPTVVRNWRNNARRIDSTRPVMVNMSRLVNINQSFAWQPVGISAKDANLEWREYLEGIDQTSLDSYALAATDSFSFSTSDYNRYGVWIYPLIVSRLRDEIVDARIPVWGFVETTSLMAGKPTPDQVVRAVWSMLIAGAKGIMYFDHRFPSPTVSQDFAAMLSDPPMKAQITALNAQMQTLAGPLNAAEAGLVESYTSSGTMAKAQGGYALGAKVPVHYTSRLAGGSSYIFAQVIREGTTTATFFVPSLAGATLTVIGEGRTVAVDGGGHFTDSFTQDYEYHLYSTATDPTFTTPANTVAPTISTDGTPQVDETVLCPTGTWTGVPSPTFAFKWQRNPGTGFVDITGATSAVYTLQAADQGVGVRCVVTASNVQGSASANSNTITPAAGAGGVSTAYHDAVMADGPVAYWPLTTMDDDSGNNLDLTSSGTVNDADSLIVSDEGTGKAKNFGGLGQLARASDDLLNPTTGITYEAWVEPALLSDNYGLVNKGAHKLGLRSTGTAMVQFRIGTTNTFIFSTTTLVVGDSYHIVGTFDGTDIKIYVNGVLDFTFNAPGSIAATTEDFQIAAAGGDVALHGTVDEVAIYPTALSASRVAAHYAAATT